MADKASGGLPNLGQTWSGGTPSSIGGSALLEGTEVWFKDETIVANGPNTPRSGRMRRARLVRNTSGISLAPGRLVTYESGYHGKRVDGYCKATSEAVAGVVDPFLPSSGVSDDDLFWMFVEGPVLVKLSVAAATAVVSEGEVLGALTAATSGAVTAGRPTVVNTASTALAASAILNTIGRAMSAATTADTGSDILVDLKILN